MGRFLPVDRNEAEVLGLDKAMVLSVIRHADQPTRSDEGRRWVMIPFTDWQRIAPWWSLSTIKRYTMALRESGHVEARQFAMMDRTLWYSICE